MSEKDIALKRSVAGLFRDLAEAAESTDTPDFSITKSGSKITITMDSETGRERLIGSKETLLGHETSITKKVTKLPKDQRRELVKHLKVNKNMTQQEIAEETMYSQKTISNDIQALRDMGEIDD